MAAPVIQSSFSAGELSPLLTGRVDLNKYKIGAAKMQNFLVDFRGGASKRAGSKFLGKAPYWNLDVLFVPFVFNDTQTYMLEVGHYYIRFITNGGYVLDGSGNVYTIGGYWHSSDLARLKWTQSGDTLTFVHPNYQIIQLIRYGHADWRLTGFSFGSTIGQVGSIGLSAISTGYIDPDAAAYVNYGYAITAVGADGTEGLLSYIATLNGVLDMATHRVTMTITWSGVSGAEYYNVYKATVGVNAQITNGSRMGFLGSTRGNTFTDTNILANFTKGPPQHNDPFTPAQITGIVMTSGGYGYWREWTYMGVNDPSGWGAVVYPTIAHSSVIGAVVEQGGLNYSAPTVFFSTNNSQYPGQEQTATGYATVSPTHGTWPGAVAYYQQRLLFAATTNAPATVWGSKPGSFHNFDTSNPINDGDSFEFTLASQQMNAIKYMIPMPGGLVMLTAGGAWQLSGTQQYAPVTPTQMMATPQAYNGCADLPPIVVGYEILFVQAAGSIVRNLSYNFFANIYTSADVTVLSSHLFANHTIKSWCYSEEPDKVIWVVRDDGALLSLTFLKDQEVAGWAVHTTAGSYKAVGCVREGTRDVVYAAVERWAGGGVYTAIEQFQPRFSRSVEESWFLDCALSLPEFVGTDAMGSGGLQDPNNVFLYLYSGSIFWAGWIGGIIRVAGGKFQIHTVLNSTQVIARQLVAPTETFLYDETGERRIKKQPPLSWKLSFEYLNLGGLDHLEGMWVSVFADGKAQKDKFVSGGRITLDAYASSVIVGLGYQADLQTLRLESQPTIQGRRKKIPALTIRVADSRGLSAGMTFNTLTEVKDLPPSVLSGVTPSLYSGDLRIVMDPLWESDGQVCIRSTTALPANIVAVIPETVLGDD
jgi:hypothetical protein